MRSTYIHNPNLKKYSVRHFECLLHTSKMRLPWLPINKTLHEHDKRLNQLDIEKRASCMPRAFIAEIFEDVRYIVYILTVHI